MDGTEEKDRRPDQSEDGIPKQDKLTGTTNVFIEIGNSDNKLTQAEWATFLQDMEDMVMDFAVRVFGMFYSHPISEHQNACFHVLIQGDEWDDFEHGIGELRKRYRQSSIALTQGDTVFITKGETSDGSTG